MPSLSLSKPLRIILYNFEDMLPLDDRSELHEEDSLIVCGSLPLHLLVVRDLKPQDLSRTLTNRIKNASKGASTEMISR